MKKMVSFFLCMAILLTSFSLALADSTPAPVELTLWVTSRHADDFNESMEQKFLETYPWITLNKVVKEGDPGNEFYQGVAVGNAPDCINVSFTMMNKYMAAGILEPINAYVDAWDEWPNFSKEYVDMFTRDGKVYGIPSQVAPMLFGYNKALLREAGVETLPATWEEALAAAEKINNPDKQIIGYATLAAEWTEWFFQYYVWQAGGDLTHENEDGTIELSFTDPAVIEAAKYYQQLRASKVMQSDLTLKFGDLVKAFGMGRIGMMPFAGDWVADAVTNGLDPDDIGLMLPPAGPAGERATAIAGGTWIINARSSQEKKDAAWLYLQFMTSREYLAAYYTNLAGKGANNPIIIPRDDMSVADYFDFPEEYRDVLAEVKTAGRLEFYGKGDFGSYVDRAVQKILVDPNADPQTEFAAAQQLAEKEALEAFNVANKK